MKERSGEVLLTYLLRDSNERLKHTLAYDSLHSTFAEERSWLRCEGTLFKVKVSCTSIINCVVSKNIVYNFQK